MTPVQRFNDNIKLVHYCMKKISYSAPYQEDIRQEGMLALWRVSQSFDESRGCSFATYAVPWILGSMRRFLRENCSTIRIPRSMWDKGESISVGSLDALIDDEKSDTVTFEHFIPGEPDFYPELFEDQIEDFLTTVTNDQHRNIYEEFVYGAVYGDAPTQKELAEKYGYSQAQVSRLIKKFRKEFRNFLNRIDKGGALWTK